MTRIASTLLTAATLCVALAACGEKPRQAVQSSTMRRLTRYGQQLHPAWLDGG
jgi:hypothetical protein